MWLCWYGADSTLAAKHHKERAKPRWTWETGRHSKGKTKKCKKTCRWGRQGDTPGKTRWGVAKSRHAETSETTGKPQWEITTILPNPVDPIFYVCSSARTNIVAIPSGNCKYVMINPLYINPTAPRFHIECDIPIYPNQSPADPSAKNMVSWKDT